MHPLKDQSYGDDPSLKGEVRDNIFVLDIRDSSICASTAKQSRCFPVLRLCDCFVATLLATTL